MPESRRRFLAAVGASIAIAGCQDGGGGADGANDTPAPTAAGDATVAVTDHDEYGEILVDSEGMALYMFDPDTQGDGSSSCSGGCLEAWPALAVDGEPTAGDGVTAELSTFERADTGETQVAADGWPLYYFASDQSPGDVNGQGVNDVWWVLRPDGTPVRTATESATPAAEQAVGVRTHDEFGDVLVDSEGMTLYMFDNDTQGSAASSCTDGCLDAWPALTVDESAAGGDGVSAEISTFERADSGDVQVVANGWPLYYFSNDESPGDANGQALNDAWWVLDPSGEPIRSSGTTEESGGGAGPY